MWNGRLLRGAIVGDLDWQIVLVPLLTVQLSCCCDLSTHAVKLEFSVVWVSDAEGIRTLVWANIWVCGPKIGNITTRRLILLDMTNAVNKSRWVVIHITEADDDCCRTRQWWCPIVSGRHRQPILRYSFTIQIPCCSDNPSDWINNKHRSCIPLGDAIC